MISGPENDLDVWLRHLVTGELQKRGWSHTELSGRTGLSRQHIGNVLNGHRSPSTTVWTLLLQAVGHEPRDWIE